MPQRRNQEKGVLDDLSENNCFAGQFGSLVSSHTLISGPERLPRCRQLPSHKTPAKESTRRVSGPSHDPWAASVDEQARLVANERWWMQISGEAEYLALQSTLL